MSIETQFVDLKLDFTFKKVFLDNHQMLLDLINAIIIDHEVTGIQEVTPKNDEDIDKDREPFKDVVTEKQEFFNPLLKKKVVFDIICTTSTGSTIIIEMQNLPYDYFEDRAVVYTSYAICHQHRRQQKNYRLSPIYFIGFLNFDLTRNPNKYISRYVLKEENTNEIYPRNKVHYIFVEFPKFLLEPDECKNRCERLIFSLKNAQKLKNMPKSFENDVFLKNLYIFANIETLSPEEKANYMKLLSSDRDYYSHVQAQIKLGLEQGLQQGHAQGLEEGLQQGREEGRQEEKLQTAKNMLKAGIPVSTIAQCTGLAEKQILDLKD